MRPEVVLLALRLALALALYAFLATLLLYLWRDFRAVARGPAEIPQSYLHRLGETPGARSYPLAAINLIGRSPDNTIVLDDVTVSANHARLTFQQGQWWLEDLGSKNGTGVNELEVEDPLVVTFGDRIRIGQVKFMLKSGAIPAQMEPFPETVEA